MPELKPDFPDDPLPPEASTEPFPVNDVASEGNPTERTLHPRKLPECAYEDGRESSMSLSPQWLYTKPSGSKKNLSVASEEQRTPSILSTENSIHPVPRHKWRLDGPQKKERRWNGLEVDSNRSWQDEEREIALPSRIDKKNGDQKVNENLKDYMQSSRKNEARWNSKWSPSWGPEDKEKEVLTEKKTDAEKEPTTRKQSYYKPSSESKIDFNNKWKPRNCQDWQPSSINRASSGVGSDRGRLEAYVGFSLGRGSTGITKGPSPETCSIGRTQIEKSEAGFGRSGASVGAFCYPRRKLLDIYRKQKLYPSVKPLPSGLEEVPGITELRSIEPLAFVAPYGEEKAMLGVIWEEKLNSSGFRDNYRRDNAEANAGVEVLTATEKKLATSPSSSNVEKAAVSYVLAEGSERSPAVSDKYPNIEENGGEGIALPTNTNVRELGFNRMDSESKLGEDSIDNDHVHAEASDFVASSKLKGAEQAADFCSCPSLSVDSISLSDLLNPSEKANDQQFVNKTEQVRQLQPVPPPEKLSYLYCEPQGEIQGPFPGVNNISWFEEGFLDMELPLRLVDAPEGTPFQELSSVIPHINFSYKFDARSLSRNKPHEPNKLEANMVFDSTPTSHIKFCSDASIEQCTQYFKSDDQVEHQNGSILSSKVQKPTSTSNTERLTSHDSVSDVIEEVLVPAKISSNSQNTIGELSFMQKQLQHSAKDGLLLNESGKINQESLESSVNAPDKHFLANGCLQMDDTLLQGASLFGDKQKTCHALSDASLVGNACANNNTNGLCTLNGVQNTLDASYFSCVEQGPNKFDLEGRLFAHQFQKQQLQQQNVQFNNPHPSLSNSLFGSVRGRLSGDTAPQLNSAYQDQVGQLSPNFEHMQFQRYQQLQFQKQQQQERQKQQQHSQARQLTLDKLIHQQEMHDHLPVFGQSKMSSLQGPNGINQVQEHFLHDLQLKQQKQHHCHSELTLEQIIQQKIGSIDPIYHRAQSAHAKQSLQWNDKKLHKMKLLLEHRQLLNKFQQDYKIKLNASELPGKQQFPLDEESQYTLKHEPSIEFSGNVMSKGFRQQDMYQHKRYTSSFEQSPISKQSRESHRQMKQAEIFYEPRSVSFGRTSLPDANSSIHMNMNHPVNSLVGEVQGLDVLEQHGYPMESLISRIHLHEDPQIPPSRPHISQLCLTGDYAWPEHDDKLPNGRSESQFYRPYHRAEQKTNDIDLELHKMGLDSGTCSVGNKKYSKRAVMDFLDRRYGTPLEENGDGGDALLSSYQGSVPARNAAMLVFDRQSSLDASLAKVPYSYRSSPGNMAGISEQTWTPYHKAEQKKNDIDLELHKMGHDSGTCSVGNKEYLKRAVMDFLDRRYGISPFTPLEENGDGDDALVSSYRGSGPAWNAAMPTFDRQSGLDASLAKVPYSYRSSPGNVAGISEQTGTCVNDNVGSNMQEFQSEMENMALESDCVQQARTCMKNESITHVRCASVGANVDVCNTVGMESGHGGDINTPWSRSVRGSASIPDSSELAISCIAISKDSRFFTEALDEAAVAAWKIASQFSETPESCGTDGVHSHQTTSSNDTSAPMPKSTKAVPKSDMRDGADESADVKHVATNQKKKRNKGIPVDPALLGFKVSSCRIKKEKYAIP